MSCYRLIDAERASYSVSLLCKVLKVSRSGYYDWKDRVRPPRGSVKTLISPSGFERSTSAAEKLMATPQYMPNSEPWECAVTASGSPG